MNAQQRTPRLLMQQLSRRGLLGAVARVGIGATGLMLVGCGGDDAETATSRRVAGTEQESPASRARQDDQQQPAVLGSHSRLAALTQAEQATAQEGVAPEGPSPAPTAIVVDPIQWRERYHWSKLKNLNGQSRGPRHGGALHIEAPAPAEWSPFSDVPSRGGYGHLLPLVYSQLIATDTGDYTDAHQTVIEGDLAARWETPDSTTVVFSLRNDVLWPERAPLGARPLTAEDVKISHDAFREPGRRQVGVYGAIAGIDADDAAGTVRFRLTEPASYLLNEMTSPWHVVIPPELLADHSATNWAQTSYGTGPFAISLSAPGRQWTLSRNRRYFKRDQKGGGLLPLLDTLRGSTFTATTRSTTAPREEGWLKGTVDAVRVTSLSDAERLREMQPGAVVQVTPPTPGYGIRYEFRSVAQGSFSDARVRQALSMSLDRLAVAEVVHGGFAAPDCAQNWTFVRDSSSDTGFREWPWDLHELGPNYQLNPSAARDLLSAAGYSDRSPLPIMLDAPAPPPVAVSAPPTDFALTTGVVADQLRESLGRLASVKLVERRVERVETSDQSIRWRSQPSETADLIYTTHEDFYSADPDHLAFGNMNSAGEWNVSGIRDEKLDEWSLAQRHAADSGERSRHLEQIRQRDAGQVWRLHLVNPYGIRIRREHVFNVVDAYFAKYVETIPKQLERSWRLD